ncbi:MAG: hypothetical protein RR858_02355 [Mucinivorans sp.]
MKKLDHIIKDGRFAVPDGGFADRVMGRVAQLPVSTRPIVVRLSPWREFRLPMIGVAVGILIFGVAITSIVDFNAWAERYTAKSEMLAEQIISKSRLLRTIGGQAEPDTNPENPEDKTIQP